MKEILNLVLVFFLSSYWLVIPVVFLGVMIFLWRKRKSKKNRWIIVVVGLIGVVLMAWYGFGRVAYYDWQVKKMCAKDGGVKVYETVELPAEMFNRWGQINFYYPTQGENSLGPEYIFKSEKEYYRKDDPVILKYVYRIIRRADNKLLGESVSYGRGGGDLPGLWHPSSYNCPDSSEPGLLKKLFVKSEKGGDEK